MSRHINRLIELAELQPGWYDGEGEAISRDALNTVGYYIHHLNRQYLGAIYPTEEGGILLERHIVSRHVIASTEVKPDPSQSVARLWCKRLGGLYDKTVDLKRDPALMVQVDGDVAALCRVLKLLEAREVGDGP